MGDEAHVRFVDAHAEGDRRRHHHFFRRYECRLVALAQRGIEAGVIGKRRTPASRHAFRQLLRLVAARCVNDSRTRLGRQQLLELPANPVARPDVISDVRPVEAGNHQAIIGDA